MKNRSGSYKKILIDADTLKSHQAYLQTNLEELKKISLSPIEFTTLYLLLFLRIKHPRNWAQNKNKSIFTSQHIDTSEKFQERCLLSLIPESFHLNDWEKEKLKGMNALDFFSLYNLKGIPQSINRAMINWCQGLWNLECLEYIPSARQLLRLQVKNTRCVTLITDPLQITSMILSARDPLSFMLHDLMHADQFFSQDESLKGQLGFYKLIDDIYDQPKLKFLLKTDKIFKKEFEYVTSDMNAYVIHLFKCLKSSILRTDSPEFFFIHLLAWWGMNEEEQQSSHLLNSPQFTMENEMILKKFFEQGAVSCINF